MYSVFSADWIKWNDRDLIATPLYDKKRFLNYEIIWTSENRYSNQNFDFTYSVNKEAPHPDNYQTGQGGLGPSLYSSKLVNLLKNYEVKREIYDVKVIDEKTKKILPLEYKIFRVLAVEDAIDHSLSEFKEEKIHEFSIQQPIKLVLNKEFLEFKPALCRIRTIPYITIIRDDVRDHLLQHNITGCNFVNIEEYSPSTFWERFSKGKLS